MSEERRAAHDPRVRRRYRDWLHLRLDTDPQGDRPPVENRNGEGVLLSKDYWGIANRGDLAQLYGDHYELRPWEEVSAPGAIESLKRVIFTDEHPAGDVNAETSRHIQRGHVLDAVPDHDAKVTRVHVRVTDAETIRKNDEGRGGLSCGYTIELDEAEGEHTQPDGTVVPYRGIHRNIIHDHLARVDHPRAGRIARLRTDSAEGSEVRIETDPAARADSSAGAGPQRRRDAMGEIEHTLPDGTVLKLSPEAYKHIVKLEVMAGVEAPAGAKGKDMEGEEEPNAGGAPAGAGVPTPPNAPPNMPPKRDAGDYVPRKDFDALAAKVDALEAEKRGDAYEAFKRDAATVLPDDFTFGGPAKLLEEQAAAINAVYGPEDEIADMLKRGDAAGLRAEFRAALKSHARRKADDTSGQTLADMYAGAKKKAKADGADPAKKKTDAATDFDAAYQELEQAAG